MKDNLKDAITYEAKAPTNGVDTIKRLTDKEKKEAATPLQFLMI